MPVIETTGWRSYHGDMGKITVFMIFFAASKVFAGNCAKIVSAPAPREWKSESFIVKKDFKTPPVNPKEQKLLLFSNGKLRFELEALEKTPECWFRITNEEKVPRVFVFKKGDVIKLMSLSVPQGIASPNRSARVIFSAQYANQPITITCSNDGPEKDFSPITYKSINEATAGYLNLACPGSK